MTLFLIGVAVLGMVCRAIQVKLDRYAASLQASPELIEARQKAAREATPQEEMR